MTEAQADTTQTDQSGFYQGRPINETWGPDMVAGVRKVDPWQIERDPRAVFGLPADAILDESTIRTAFVQRAHELGSPATQNEVAWKELNAAHEIIRDPVAMHRRDTEPNPFTTTATGPATVTYETTATDNTHASGGTNYEYKDESRTSSSQGFGYTASGFEYYPFNYEGPDKSTSTFFPGMFEYYANATAPYRVGQEAELDEEQVAAIQEMFAGLHPKNQMSVLFSILNLGAIGINVDWKLMGRMVEYYSALEASLNELTRGFFAKVDYAQVFSASAEYQPV